MPRIKSIAELQPFKSSTVSMRAPKAATSKAPDYVVLTEVEKKTVRRGGKIVNVSTGSKTIYPEPSIFNAANACSMGKGKKQLRACHVELLMLGTKHAPAFGVDPGAYLRLCTKVNDPKAPLVRVRDHQEAQRISKEFCACRKTGKSADACARQIGKSSGRAGARRRRS